MKILKIAALFAVILTVIAFSGCEIDLSGAYPTPTPSTHTCEFEFSKDLYVAPTCTSYGKEVYKCSCGEINEAILDPIAHTTVAIPESPSAAPRMALPQEHIARFVKRF